LFVIVALGGCFQAVESGPCGPDAPCEPGRHCVADRCEIEPMRDDVGTTDGGVDLDGPVPDGPAPDVATADGAADTQPDIAPDGAPDVSAADLAPLDATPDGPPADVASDAMSPDARPPEPCLGDAPFDLTGRPCPDDDTLALWRFDEPGFAAVSGIAPENPPNLAEQIIAAEAPDQGRFGGAVAFRGDGDQRLEYNGLEDVLPPFTIEAWVRPDGFAGVRQVIASTITGHASNWHGGWELALVPDEVNGIYTLRFSWSDGTEIRVPSGFTTRRSVPPRVWSHVAMTVDRAGTVTLWVSGASEVGPRVVEIDRRMARFTLGNRASRVDGPFSGRLDEIRLSLGVRPPEQIMDGADPP